MPTLNLVDESVSPRTEIDMYFGDCQVLNESWLPQFGEVEEESVTQSIPLYIPSNAATLLNTFDTLLFKARQAYTDPFNAYDIWFEFAPNGGQLVRFLVIGGSWQFARGAPGQNSLLEDDRCTISLSLTTLARAEDTTSDTDSDTAMDSLGDYFVSSNVPGTAPARIFKTLVDEPSNDNIDEIWLGIRPPYQGIATPTFASSLYAWNVTIGEPYGDDTVTEVTPPSDAIGTEVVKTTFATNANMTWRWFSGLPDWNDVNEWTVGGKYLLLLRMISSDSSSIYAVRGSLDFKNVGSDVGIHYPAIEVSGDSWLLYPMMVYINPPGGHISGFDGSGHALYLRVSAERISGSGTLYYDAFSIIPASHMIHVKGILGGELQVTIEKDGRIRVYAEAGIGDAVLLTAPDIKNWEMPIGQSLVVAAGQRDGVHVSTDTLDVSLEYFPRWRGIKV